jgi:NADH:ubiquinone oxidoreductase subunit 3 (subunit A)
MLWVLVYTSLDTSAKLVMFLFVGMTLLALYYALKKEEVIWI